MLSVVVLPILFIVPAKFVTKPKSSVIAYKNWDMILKCDIFGYPVPEVKWTRSLKELPVNRHFINGNELTIKNTTEDDGGAYLCEGENQLGSVIAVTWINVKGVGKLRIEHGYFHEEDCGINFCVSSSCLVSLSFDFCFCCF